MWKFEKPENPPFLLLRKKVSDSINQIMETKAEKAYNPFLMLLRKKIENSNIFFKRKKDFTK